MKYTNSIFLYIVLVASVLLSPYSFAEKTVRLNVQESLDVAGKQRELDHRLQDILHAIEQESHLKFKLEMLPWKRAQQETLNGNGIIWGLRKTVARQKLFQFSEIVAFQKVWAFTYGSEPSLINSVNDLQGKTVCVSRGVSHGFEFEQATQTIFKVQEDVASTSVRFRKLIAKRCDVMLLPIRKLIARPDISDYVNKQFAADLAGQDNGHGRFVPSNQPIFLETIHFASAKGHYEDVLEALNHAIIKLMRIEKFRQLMNDFY